MDQILSSVLSPSEENINAAKEILNILQDKGVSLSDAVVILNIAERELRGIIQTRQNRVLQDIFSP